jgi:hypothetical protein
MGTTQYRCSNTRRRTLVAEHASLNGIDYVEVFDLDAIPVPSPRQRTLLVRFLKPVPALTVANVVIEGGVRITPVKVLWAVAGGSVTAPPATAAEEMYFNTMLAEPDRCLVVRADSEGDFSTYRLRLVDAPGAALADLGLDPQLAALDFTFKAECPSEFDCRAHADCPPDSFVEPEINYLAKDYASFRRLVLDRLAAVMPDWRERSPADLGVALVELTAYVGDHLSYYQDAVATEAYLGTARSRVSVRRHARLLDYRMHEGCNARAWVCIGVTALSDADGAALEAGQMLVTGTDGSPPVLDPAALGEALRKRPVVFETRHGITLRAAHNTIRFHTWSDEECCLPRGATRATLRDAGLALAPGDVLVLEEVVGPETGDAADADPARRHAVRLLAVNKAADVLDGTAVVEVAWREDDALPFPLCVSRRIGTAGLVPDISVCRGNVALADHGRSFSGPDLLPTDVPHEGRYRPQFVQRGITHAQAFDPAAARLQSARAAVRQDPRGALPQVALTGDGRLWAPRFDLLASDRFAPEFVLEVESDGRSFARFGDDVLGKQPSADAAFSATYRIGNGAAGNVGREAITQLVTTLDGVEVVRNPIAAGGGTDPEPVARVRFDAPQAFRTQDRAVTEDDYARAAERHADVQRAAARFRWTGSWYTVFVAVDRKGGRPVDAGFRRDLRAHLEHFRLAGYDLEIRPPLFVPLDLAIRVCAGDGYFRADVKAALARVFSAVSESDGTTGFFHPDNFSFGDPVYLSRIYAAATAVDGVRSVEVTRFQRWGKATADELAHGFIQPASVEILQLANDPSFPEGGRLDLDVGGGI